MLRHCAPGQTGSRRTAASLSFILACGLVLTLLVTGGARDTLAAPAAQATRAAATVLPTVTAVGAALPLPSATPTLSPTPTLTPTPALTGPSVTAVVGAQGADLWAEDGGWVARLDPGAKLALHFRSDNGRWLFAQTGQDQRGWVAADRLLSTRLSQLPSRSVVILPVTPTPSPAPTAAPEASRAATTERRAAAATPAQTPRPTPAADGRPRATVTLANSRLNVRAGPGAAHPVVAKALPGEVFAILGRDGSGDWIELEVVDIPGGFGWVAAEYVTVSQPLLSLPISQRVNRERAMAPAPAAAEHALNTTTPAETGLQGRLVIQESYGGAIHVYDLATGEVRALTQGFDPAISPDGREVAFTREGGDNGIYIIGMDGSNERAIFTGRAMLRSPKWSPDGEWIAFARSDESIFCRKLPDGRCMPDVQQFSFFPLQQEWQPVISRVDRNGRNFRDIVSLVTAKSPDWNAAGIVYQSKAGIQLTADIANAVTQLVYFDIRKQYHNDPDWQPGGGAILFQQKELDHWEIYRINPDGSARVALTRPATTLVNQLPSNVAPAWSPDGRHIVFLSNRDEHNEAGAWGVWVMAADGSDQRRLPIDLPIAYSHYVEQAVDWGR